ncbi:MAG: hypothetical protein CMJ19_05590 [Phycisphaeraceae bacterium]|nr:hypothetical protein [Phycisphaeraceae bacterium]
MHYLLRVMIQNKFALTDNLGLRIPSLIIFVIVLKTDCRMHPAQSYPYPSGPPLAGYLAHGQQQDLLLVFPNLTYNQNAGV